MTNKSLIMEQKRFNRLNEAAISYEIFDTKQLAMIKALVESFNTKFKTHFYFDEKHNEIVNGAIVKEANFANYKKMISLLENKGIKCAIRESVVQDLNGLSRLVESELAQAEIILAAQSIGDRLQKMAEDLAQMVSEDVLPITDQMKSVFGTQLAEDWSQKTKSALEGAFATVSQTKDTVTDSTLVLERKLEGEDTVNNDMMNTDSGDDSMDDLGLDDESGDDSMDDLMGGSDAASGPEDEPLGRAKKESREYKKKSLSESENPVSKMNAAPNIVWAAGRDFDIEDTHGDYVLGTIEHDDGDRHIQYDYIVAKFDSEKPIASGYNPQKLYKVLGWLNEKSTPKGTVGAAWNKFKSMVDAGENVTEGGMPSSVIKSKQRYAEMSDADLAEKLADKSETELRQMAWRHGYGKMSDHYLKRVNAGKDAVTEHEDSSSYVGELEAKGYSVEEVKSGTSKLFVVSKDGKTGFMEEPETGTYQIIGFDDNFSSLGDAVSAFFRTNETRVMERNAFAHAVQKAKAAGAEEFELDGKKYKVEECDCGENTYSYEGRHYSVTETELQEDETELAKKALDKLKNGNNPAGKPAAPAPNARPDPKQDKMVKDMAMAIQRNPSLKKTVTDILGEAVETVREDISLGIKENAAIRNAAIIHEVDIKKLEKAWLAKTQ